MEVRIIPQKCCTGMSCNACRSTPSNARSLDKGTTGHYDVLAAAGARPIGVRNLIPGGGKRMEARRILGFCTMRNERRAGFVALAVLMLIALMTAAGLHAGTSAAGTVPAGKEAKNPFEG